VTLVPVTFPCETNAYLWVSFLLHTTARTTKKTTMLARTPQGETSRLCVPACHAIMFGFRLCFDTPFETAKCVIPKQMKLQFQLWNARDCIKPDGEKQDTQTNFFHAHKHFVTEKEEVYKTLWVFLAFKLFGFYGA